MALSFNHKKVQTKTKQDVAVLVTPQSAIARYPANDLTVTRVPVREIVGLDLNKTTLIHARNNHGR